MGHPYPVFPSLDVVYGASREQLLDLLDFIDELRAQGVSPPDGYLFAVTGALMHAEAEMLELEQLRTSRPGLPAGTAGPDRWLRSFMAFVGERQKGRSPLARGNPSP